VRSIVLFLMFLAILPADGWGIDNNPVGRGTAPAGDAIGVGSGRVPGGTYRDGLVRSPSLTDSRGNLIVTGNVRGGKHFRGIVPYQSRYSFETDLPSSSLDSFLRYSAGSEDIRGGSGNYMTQPYYSGTRTVTAARPDDRGIIRPDSTRIEDRAGSKSVLPPLLRQEALVREGLVAPYTGIKLRPLSMTPSELEQVISDETQAFLEGNLQYPLRNKLAGEQRRPPLELLPGRQKAASDKMVELGQNLLVEGKLLQLPAAAESDGKKQEEIKTKVPEQLMGEEASDALGGQEVAPGVLDLRADVYEQMKRQISSVRRFLEQPAGVEQAKEEVKTTDEAKRRDEELFAATKARRETRRTLAEKEGKRELTSSKELPLQPSPEGEAAERGHILEEQFGPELTAEGLSGKGPVDKEVDTELKGDVAAKAREILGEHKTFASFAEDKFNRHMRAAEEYLKRGRFYRAADAYTLASIYKPDDPLAYAGKSHALFAAGEYMSSALFLSRALEIFPEYAQFKIDLVAMVGDKDKLESRIANVEQWLDESGAAELQFLLGYVYYQMGRHPEAQEMINAAFEKMPESPAVVALKKAIADAAE